MKTLLIFTVVLLLNLVVFAWFNRGALVQILALRQQLTVYKRKAKKPRLRNRGSVVLVLALKGLERLGIGADRSETRDRDQMEEKEVSGVLAEEVPG